MAQKTTTIIIIKYIIVFFPPPIGMLLCIYANKHIGVSYVYVYTT